MHLAQVMMMMMMMTAMFQFGVLAMIGRVLHGMLSSLCPSTSDLRGSDLEAVGMPSTFELQGTWRSSSESGACEGASDRYFKAA